ncbi:Hypothetical protein FKW44_012020 [Caligus rogercresseyi]|uniref:Uncharacterized protein n=1 Tax=Caligus rogercresseyi TaxID=217165 RepID=A0A7T8HJ56_CALRO|nr:Hypothetical protein FKW44_012020 [Caligus rogercresseyi]
MLTNKKKPMLRVKSNIFFEDEPRKVRAGAIMDSDLKRLQVERDFLDGVSRAIKPKEEVLSEKEARMKRLNKKKKVKTQHKPKCELLQFTEDTLGFIDSRKQFWASLAINKGHNVNEAETSSKKEKSRKPQLKTLKED